jgi:lipopolysaccharide assembly protein A
MKLLKLLPKIIIFVLILILVLNNMQRVEFNLYGIYIWNLPLIVIILITFIIGIIIGFSLRIIKLAELKLQIHNLKKDLEKQSSTTE